MGRMRWIGVAVVVSALAACGFGDEPETSTTNEALTNANGVWQNGLTTNGVWQNGVWQNGVWQNGVWQNGVWQNGVWQNGVWQNGVWQNGVWQNGVWQNGVWQNGAWQGNLAARAVLNENEYAGQLLQYIYSCAMPAGKTASLDRDGKPPLVLTGAIGLAPQWGEDGGTCDETCQHWVSACVLARTNAYGAHVEISMRAPDDAPDAIKQALAVSEQERGEFTLREGAYYGNLFATTPVDPTPDYTLNKTILVTNTPKFYACAGPGSNIPQITKRFASSQGDDGPITNTGVCLATPYDVPACAGADTDPASPTFGAMRDCNTPTGEAYKEVITVYLKQPIAVCGDGVCDGGTETSDTCPSDCHPGTWGDVLQSWQMAVNAVDPIDHSIVTLTHPIGGAPGPVNVTKYTAEGAQVWSETFQPADLGMFGINVDGLVVGSDHTIAMILDQTTDDGLHIAKLDGDGRMVPGWPLAFGGVGRLDFRLGMNKRATAIDSDNNIYVAGQYTGAAIFGTLPALPNANLGGFVVKITPTGQAMWATALAGSLANTQVVGDTVLVASSATVTKLSLATGAVVWSMNAIAGTEIDGAAGAGTDVYVAGRIFGTVDFGAAVGTGNGGGGYYVAKYDANKTNLWAKFPAVCSGCVTIYHQITFDPLGNVVVSGMLGSGYGPMDFGRGGAFRTFKGSDAFMASYAPADGYLWWAKLIPAVLYSNIDGLTLDGSGRMTMSGTFKGSMTLDGRLLVSALPESNFYSNNYVGSFLPPCSTPGCDTVAPSVDNVPTTIVLLATSAAGATGWYMLPTSIDDQFAGTNVYCDPPANSTFPIGTTKVTCTATDPVGNSQTAFFYLKVVDLTPPTMIAPPQVVDVTASGASGAVVSYPLPVISDQVTGVTMTCDPPSGSTFAIGTTIVTCTATDAYQNISKVSFDVNVEAGTAASPTPPMLTLPASFSVEAASSAGSPVTYAASAVDDTDGAVPVSCFPGSGSLFPLGSTTVTCSAHDAANSTATGTFVVTVADTTAPSLLLSGPSAVEATSSAGAVVSYDVAATDVVGVFPPACDHASGTLFPIGSTLVTCSVSDFAGHITTAQLTVTVRDTTAPALSLPASFSISATSSTGATATFITSASDIVTRDVVATCTPTSGSTFPIGSTLVACSATDAAGNTSTGSFTVTVLDQPPVITAPTTTVNATLGSAVTYSVSASDDLDGNVTVTCNPPSGSTFSIGSTTVTCTATDSSGHTTTTSFVVNVTASWSGFLQPINNDGSSLFKQGNTIPVKFALTGASAGITTLRATIRVAKLSNSIVGSDLEVVSSGSADTGSVFRYDPVGGIYVYNLATTNLSAGTYMIYADLGDGVTRGVQVSLKK